MSIACLSRSTNEPPDKIIDTSTMSVTLDNQGIAVLQLIILTKNTDPITDACYTFDFGNATFNGFVESDSPRKLEGSEYYEHTIVAKGMIC